MPDETQSSYIQNKLPLQGVIIFVSQQLGSNRTALHQQCTALGGKYVWVFDVPFTHYICQGKLSKRGKEYKKVEEYRAACVHPAWLKACEKFGQRVAEKLYATTYKPNRSLSFVSAGDDDNEDDEDEENQVPSLTIAKPVVPTKSLRAPRNVPIMTKKLKPQLSTPISMTQQSSVKVALPAVQSSSQISNEAETIISDLESSLAQFLHNNSSTSLSRPSITEQEPSRKSHPVIRAISNMNHTRSESEIEPSMRVEWLDDAMQAERKKMIDEDEQGSSQQQAQLRCGESKAGKKRPLVDSNFDQAFNAKKCRT